MTAWPEDQDSEDESDVLIAQQPRKQNTLGNESSDKTKEVLANTIKNSILGKIKYEETLDELFGVMYDEENLKKEMKKAEIKQIMSSLRQKFTTLKEAQMEIRKLKMRKN